MFNQSARLNPKLFDADVEQASSRDGFGNGVVEAGKKDERVVDEFSGLSMLKLSDTL